MTGKNTYASEIAFLSKNTEIVELAAGDARVAVAPEYQGRVMTSTLAGAAGAGFGWINTKFINAGKDDPVFNNYGGEDRFWLGPEAGQFALWFKKGEPFDLAHWKTPPGFNGGRFLIVSQSATSVAMSQSFEVTNYAGTNFKCDVLRTISTLGVRKAGELFDLPVPEGVKLVGFESVNVLKNAGDKPWTRDGGLVSIWILGMFKPLSRGKVIVPFKAGSETELGPRATTDYFGHLPAERCRVTDDHLFLVCDGKFRSKIGISPARATDVLGSYDPVREALTIVQFNLPASAPELPYVNSLWQFQARPFAGDVVNSYNDGEPEPGAAQLGPFYEIETSSPAAALEPGQSITHIHRTFHITDSFETMNEMAAKVLGTELAKID